MASLINLGNTCAINSILQAISHTLDIPDVMPEQPLTRSLFGVVSLMQKNPNKILKPSTFIKQFYEAFQNEFRSGYQIDAQELWIFLSNKIFCETSYIVPQKDDKTFNNPLFKQAHEQISLHNNNKACLWNDIYQGSTITIIKCLECNNKTFNFETFYELNINPNNNIVSMLTDFFSFHELQDDWRCDVCKRCTRHMKSIKLWHAPKVLVLCIKRYNNSLQKTNDEIHINKNINFGTTSILSIPKKTKKYSLRAIVNHYGFYGGGHYDCIITDPIHPTMYDDCNKSEYKMDCNRGLKSRNAYMLFYVC